MNGEKFKLKRTHQCKKCPWKVSTNPHEIPGGYCETKHRNLESTISKDPISEMFSGIINVMACHHSEPGREEHCVGWIYNQLGVGNNVALRMKMRNCENIFDLRVVGPQHELFEDTLPKGPEVFEWTLDSIMPFGKYKKCRIKEVPSWHLIEFLDGKTLPDLKFGRFLKSIEHLIRSEDWGKRKEEECPKVYFLSRQEANKRLKHIQMNGDWISEKKPIRSYECPKCGFWHLTSMPFPQ